MSDVTPKAEPSSATPTLAGKPEDYEMNVFDCDLPLRLFRRSGLAPRYGLILPLALIFLAGLSAVLSGVFSQPHLASALCHDAAVLLRNPDWSCRRSHTPDATFSFVRDSSSIIIIAVIGTEPVLIYRQWLGFERLFPSLVKRGLIVPHAGSEHVLQEQIERANRHFRAVGSAGSVFALLASVVAVPIVTGERTGLYGIFRDASFTPNAWSEQTYNLWWASFDAHPIAWATYTLILIFGIYAAIIMNVVAVRPILVIWRTRKHLTVLASPDNEDGYYGWLQPREILSAGYIATAIYGIAISCLSLTLQGNARWVVAPLVIQWIGVLPAHLYIPLSLTVRAISNYKATEIGWLTDELTQLQGVRTLEAEEARELLARRLERVRSIRTLPFRSLRDIGSAVFLFVASLCSIYAAAGLWYHVL